MAKAPRKINPDLEKLIKKMVEDAAQPDAVGAPAMKMDDKFRVIDRALKLEMLRFKVEEDDWGSDFDQQDREA